MFRNFRKNVFGKIKKYKSYVILMIIFMLLIYSAYEYYNKYFYMFKDPDKIKHIIMSYGKYSILAFFILQIIQVVAFFIPGEIVQIAGGYIYGTLGGSIISLLGITTGSMIVFGISHSLGKPLIDKVVSNKDANFFKRILNLGHINFMVFLLYLIPGIPKDVLAYICGVSNVTFKNFIIYSTLGRVPGIFISAYFGAKIDSGNKAVLIFIAVIMTMLFSIGVFKGEALVKKIIKHSSSKNK
ncbi:TVP38/TMEM64 family protein [Clostridium sp. P21]|uniref:TVP38/TMEM64 family membrane protein n=1 Tax=Clostridium muellerianum TaxID=2716538 RepID=A0A7Y0HQT7_9CLOT|nr:TVP38/TMEM64 family protein [Clostridium muellerianum]NMM65445.1 TVP38/TMEM64 family protein [Clostridium muellerianum]